MVGPLQALLDEEVALKQKLKERSLSAVSVGYERRRALESAKQSKRGIARVPSSRVMRPTAVSQRRLELCAKRMVCDTSMKEAKPEEQEDTEQRRIKWERFHQRSFSFQHERERYIESLRQKKEEVELEGCTFEPQTRGRSSLVCGSLFDRVRQMEDRKESRITEIRQELLDKEMAQCSFSPQIVPCPRGVGERGNRPSSAANYSGTSASSKLQGGNKNPEHLGNIAYRAGGQEYGDGKDITLKFFNDKPQASEHCASLKLQGANKKPEHLGHIADRAGGREYGDGKDITHKFFNDKPQASEQCDGSEHWDGGSESCYEEGLLADSAREEGSDVGLHRLHMLSKGSTSLRSVDMAAEDLTLQKRLKERRRLLEETLCPDTGDRGLDGALLQDRSSSSPPAAAVMKAVERMETLLLGEYGNLIIDSCDSSEDSQESDRQGIIHTENHEDSVGRSPVGVCRRPKLRLGEPLRSPSKGKDKGSAKTPRTASLSRGGA
jgi:hypothetical protein